MSWLQRASVAGVAAVATLGVGLSTGTLDPAVALATGAVAGQLSGPAAEEASPDRIVRVSMYEIPSASVGGTVWSNNTWSAAWPQSGSDRRHEQKQFDTSAPSSPGGPSRPELPIGTPLDGSYPWRLIHDSVNPKVELEPMHACAQPHGPGQGMNLELKPSVGGTVSASWWDLGDPDTRYYKLGAVPMSQTGGTEIRWSGRIPAPNACRTVTGSVSGLVKGQAYVFYLEAVNTDPKREGRTYSRTRAESAGVTIP